MKTATPVVELVRVSSDSQALEGRAGIAAQRATNRQTAARFGLRIIETVEVVESGATVANSEEMARVLHLVREGRASGILLASYDRLFRPDNWADLAILQVFMDARAHIYVPSGPIDLRTEPGYVQASVSNLLAGLERIRIKERTMRAKEERRRQGKLASGRPPYGLCFDKAKGEWSYTPEIERIRELFALFLSGRERSYKELGKRFGFHDTHVRALLQHPAYSGWLEWKREDDRGTIRVPLGLEPVVSEADFAEVQRIIETRSSRLSLARRGSEGRFLYRGMLFCTCDAPLYPSVKFPHGKRWDMYACRTTKEGEPCGASSMSVHLLEPKLDQLVEERLADPGFVFAAVEEFNRAAAAEWRGAMPSPETGRRRSRELEARRARVVEAFYDGVTTREQRDKELRQIDEQLSALKTYELPAAGPARVDPEDVAELLHVFHEWSMLEWEQRRRILEAITPAFKVLKYDVRGVWLPAFGPEQGGSRTSASGAKQARHGNCRWERDFRSGLYVPLGAGAA